MGLLALLLAWGTLFPPASQGQTFAEIFRQKKTQKKYLLEQIAALEVYAGYARKGYQLASSGLKTIRGFTRGEFSLHQEFLASLAQVSPFIQKHWKVVSVIALQLEISRSFAAIGASELMSESDLSYIRQVKQTVLDDCAADLEELLTILSAGKLEMDPAARLQRLEQLHQSMQDKAGFTQEFCSEAISLAHAREKALHDIGHLKLQYGIAP